MKSEEIIKERGYAKGLITKTITNLKTIPKKPDNLEQVKEKLNNLSELITKFEEIHTRLYSQLHDEEERHKHRNTEISSSKTRKTMKKDYKAGL